MQPMYDNPETHAANPPETWKVEKDTGGRSGWWDLYVSDISNRPIMGFRTKREAVAATTEGKYFDAWHTDARWFAGEAVHGRKLYREVLDQRAAAERAAARKAARSGTTVEELAKWKSALGAADPVLADVLDAARDMFRLIDDGHLIDIDALDRDEALALHRDLAETWGVSSDIEIELHRTKYLGIGADRTAVEVLEDLAEIEREQSAFALSLPTR
ncbi:hypothetical protein [Agromyces humi]|uniref:hypothetical protein n=1 Tax=Agromyces humi TaxID=1766800 RepID=UPI00135BF699|nr:hypothetical protein [Agromyces humi]